MTEFKFKIEKKNGSLQEWDPKKIETAVQKSAARVEYEFSEAEVEEIIGLVLERIEKAGKPVVSRDLLHVYVEMALSRVNESVAKSYKEFRNWKQQYAADFSDLYKKSNSIRFRGDRENANKDSSLVSVQQAIVRGELGRKMYRRTFLTAEELSATESGYIYIHDTDFRLDTMNCCLFNAAELLREKEGKASAFTMANMPYRTPKTLFTAGEVIGDVVLSAAPQQYGGFTLPEIDKILAPYAEKSYEKFVKMFTEECGMGKNEAESLAWQKTVKEAEQLFQGWEYKFNTVGSSRGDYPFITTSFGLATDRFGKMLNMACLKVRREGQGEKGKEKPVLFPKLVFIYDEALHGEGKELEDVFNAAIECSKKAMYPDFLSVSGEGYIPSVYKKWGKVISPMGCRAFLSPYYKYGGQYESGHPDEEPVFEGRFNIGVVSLHLPMILAKARQEDKNFFEVLDYYLEMIRSLHKRTYTYLGQMKASTNPLGYCEGGFYGGHLKPDDTIEPILDSATASFGITALNELQMLYNGKSLTEDGAFALETLQYINRKVEEFKKEDHHLYAIYGTPAESLCGKQVQQFRKAYGIVKGVSDREYVSNSFHCHVTEDITPTEKQDYEARFWDLCNGGKIQYVRYPVDYNTNAVKALIRRAMAKGFYEGVNMSLSFCNNCGHEELEMDACPVCGSRDLTKIDRMNGYLAYSRTCDGDSSRLNAAKMAEIAERKSM